VARFPIRPAPTPIGNVRFTSGLARRGGFPTGTGSNGLIDRNPGNARFVCIGVVEIAIFCTHMPGMKDATMTKSTQDRIYQLEDQLKAAELRNAELKGRARRGDGAGRARAAAR